MLTPISYANAVTNGAGNVAWKAMTGRPCVDLAKSETLRGNGQSLDSSHQPSDTAELSEADRLAVEEKKANKHLKSYYAAATVFDSTVRMLGTLGNFWGMIQGVMGSTPSGWTAAWAGAGSAFTVGDAAFQVKTAAVNRNTPAAIDGTFTMVQGMGVMLVAMGLGRVPALVAVGAMVGKMGYGMYRSVQDEKEKKERKAEDAERKKQAAAKPVSQPPAASQPAAAQPSQPSVPAVTDPASIQPAPYQPPAATAPSKP